MNFGDRKLFSNVNLFMERGRKVVLLGPNGCGKTTLLKIITSELEPSEGHVLFSGQKMGFVKQFRFTKDRTLYEEGLSAFKDALNAYDRAMKGAISSDIDSYDTFLRKAESLGIYSVEKKVRRMLKGVGFSQDDFERRLSTLSAGEITKLQLAKILSAEPDLLVLDEPGNYLDVYGILFLQDTLLSIRSMVLIATHDRNLMGKIPDEIWDMDFGTVKSYKGKYSSFLIQKENYLKTIQSKEKSISKKINHLHNVVERYRKWGREKAIRQAKSKEKQLYRLVKAKENQKIERRKTFTTLNFDTYGVTEGVVLGVENLKVMIDDKHIGDFSFQIHNGEKVVLLGKNGIGKTTLLKEIVKKGPQVEFGPNTIFAYVDTVGSNRTPETLISTIWKFVQNWPDYEVRRYLGRFGFEGDDVFKSLDSLSGGEFVRFEISKVLLKNPNFLIMDEPTNHLDVYMMESLEETLKGYTGTVFFSTHDLEFAKHVANRFFILENKEIHSFSEYDQAVEFLENSFIQKHSSKHGNNVGFERKKSLRNKLKSLERELKRYESQFEELERVYEDLEGEMNRWSRDHMKLTNLSEKRKKVEQEMEKIIENIDSLEFERKNLEEEVR